ncbi:MAG: hypothetical protein L0Y64_11655 [Myxococcaceae bacterium]|nr:hypothetical protein [Myxococcaceae bacterium]
MELHPYHFRVAAEGEAARGVECAVKTARVSLHEEGTTTGRPVTSETSVDIAPRTLTCVVTGDREGTLTLEHRPGPGLLGQMAGSMRVEHVSLDIASNTQLEGGGQLAFAGYHLRFGQELVAAVETVNDGRVWLAPGLAPEVREAAVVGAAALLLDRDWPTDAD